MMRMNCQSCSRLLLSGGQQMQRLLQMLDGSGDVVEAQRAAGILAIFAGLRYLFHC